MWRALSVAALVLGASPTQQPRHALGFSRDDAQTRMVHEVGLTDDEAKAVMAQLAHFEQKRMPAFGKMVAADKVLRSAGTGDKAAQAQFNQALAEIFAARAQIEAINREMISEIGRDLSPEKRAKLVVFELAQVQHV